MFASDFLKKFFEKNGRRLFFGTVFALVAANIFAWNVVVSERRGDELTVAFLNVGQGDAIFIEAPNGNQIIFDGGPNGKILTELSEMIPFYDRTIDMIVVTNPDKDHYAGFLDLLARYEVEKFMEAGTKTSTILYGELKKSVDREGSEKLIAQRGMKIELDQERGIYIEVLFPDGDVSKLKTNDGSIIAKLVYGDTSVMLTGDAPDTTENKVVQLDGEKDALRSNVLKVGHHGSKTSTSEEFLKEVLPKYAVISSGKGNRYGHPTDEVIDILKKYNVEILRTDELGTIIMKSDGRKISIK